MVWLGLVCLPRRNSSFCKYNLSLCISSPATKKNYKDLLCIANVVEFGVHDGGVHFFHTALHGYCCCLPLFPGAIVLCCNELLYRQISDYT